MAEGRFEPRETARRGGQSVVLRALDRVTGNEVALKLPARQDPASLSDLLGEASLLARLRHPCLPTYIAHGIDPELGPFLALGWIEGEPLGRRLDRGPLSPREAAGLGARLSDALSALHEAGVVHGDVQPDNVMLPAGSLAEARLIDLGMARSRRSTLQGRAGGTPGYAAPEVVLQGEVGPASDLFSLGVLLWACLTGRPLFARDDAAQSVASSVLAEAPPLDDLRAPEPLADLIAALLRKEPRGRPTAAQARALLLSLAAGPARASPRARTAPIRARELSWLDACAALSGGRVVLVKGAPGTGKSSLRRAWTEGAWAQGYALWEASGQRDSAPFAAIRALLASAMGLDAHPSEQQLQSLAAGLLPADEARGATRLLAVLWNIPTSDDDPLAALARSDPALGSLLIEQAWCSLVGAAAAQLRLALVIDDLHWCDAPSLRLLEGCVARAGGLLVAFSRPVSSPPFAACAVETLELSELGDDEARELVRAVWPEASGAQVDEVVGRGGGLPLFLAELAAAGRGETPSGRAGAGHARSLRGVIEDRVAERSGLEHQVLRAAALLGFRAPREGLDALLGDRVSPEVMSAVLAQLTGAWLLQREAGAEVYTFRHELIREVALAEPAGDEQELHGRALRWLREQGEQDALLAWHAEQAGEAAEAAARYTAAGWRSLGLDFPLALRLAERALSCAPAALDLPLARACRAAALASLGRWSEASEAGQAAAASAPPGSLVWLVGTATRCFACFEAGRLAETHRLLALLASTEPAPDALHAAASLAIGAAALCLGGGPLRLASLTEQRLRQLLALAPSPAAEASAWRVRALVARAFEGDLAQAAAASSRALELHAHGGDPLSALHQWLLVGLLDLAVGMYRKSIQTLTETIELADRLGAGATSSFARVALAEALLGSGSAEDALVPALAALDAPGLGERRLLRGWTYRVLGAVQLALGDRDEALRCTAESLEFVNFPCTERLAALVQRSDALRTAGHAAGALAAAEEAVALLGQSDPVVQDEACARGCLAAQLLARGDEARGRAVLQEASADLRARAARLDGEPRAAFLARPAARRVLALGRRWLTTTGG